MLDWTLEPYMSRHSPQCDVKRYTLIKLQLTIIQDTLNEIKMVSKV